MRQGEGDIDRRADQIAAKGGAVHPDGAAKTEMAAGEVSYPRPPRIDIAPRRRPESALDDDTFDVNFSQRDRRRRGDRLVI